MAGGSRVIARGSPWRDYLALTKPRVVSLHLVTAAAAMLLAARGLPQAHTFFLTLTGGGLLAAASNSLNCYLDRDIDGLMDRTRERPLPAGRLKPESALTLGLVLGSAGWLILSAVGAAVALLALAALGYYVLVYTAWLKRRTYWSSIAGCGAGAFPPLIGWVAVLGRIDITPVILFLVIALWTPPHFWSLALYRHSEYDLAGISAVPGKNAGRWIFAFSLATVSISLLLVPLAGMGAIYAAASVLLGICFIYLSTKMLHGEALEDCLKLYLFSMFYLVALFAALIVDRLVIT